MTQRRTSNDAPDGDALAVDRKRAVTPASSEEASIGSGPVVHLAGASQVALIGLFVIALLWCAFVARPVIVPIVLAWALATIVLPLVTRMEAHKVPRVVAALAVTLLLVLVVVSLLLLLSTPVAYWIGRASEFGSVMKDKLQGMSQPLALLQELQKTLNVIGSSSSQPTLKVEQSSTVVETIASTLTPAVSQALLFIGAFTFYLVYQKRLRTAVVHLVPDRAGRLAALRTLTDIDDSMSVYFGTFTLVNLVLALLTTLLTWAVGLPNPLLWGVLAGVLNYVPYIGPAIVIGTLSVVGLMTFSTLGEAAVAPLAFMAVVTIEGHFITPTIMGRRLELNPFAVFLAIAFCTWIWGPIGAFLAVPLLVAMTLAFAHAFSQEKLNLPD